LHGNRPQEEASDELLDIRVQTGANCGEQPIDAGGAGGTGVSADDAQAEDEVLAEEALALHDDPVAEDSDEEKFADPWSEYFAIMDDNWDNDFDLDMHEPGD
jgi:hypothetical protein